MGVRVVGMVRVREIGSECPCAGKREKVEVCDGRRRDAGDMDSSSLGQ